MIETRRIADKESAHPVALDAHERPANSVVRDSGLSPAAEQVNTVSKTGPEKDQSLLSHEYLTPDGLAHELGTSLRTLARWHAKRIGPPRTIIGRTILYRRESVAAWLREREERPVRRRSR